jgi:hypothetical protein
MVGLRLSTALLWYVPESKKLIPLTSPLTSKFTVPFRFNLCQQVKRTVCPGRYLQEKQKNPFIEDF